MGAHRETTVRQEEFVAVMVRPDVKTLSDAGRLLGVSHPSASQMARHPNVRKGIREHRDSASRILGDGLERIEAELPLRNADFAGRAVQLATDVVVKLGGGTDPDPEASRSRDEWRILGRRALRRCYQAGYRAAMIGHHATFEEMQRDPASYDARYAYSQRKSTHLSPQTPDEPMTIDAESWPTDDNGAVSAQDGPGSTIAGAGEAGPAGGGGPRSEPEITTGHLPKISAPSTPTHNSTENSHTSDASQIESHQADTAVPLPSESVCTPSDSSETDEIGVVGGRETNEYKNYKKSAYCPSVEGTAQQSGSIGGCVIYRTHNLDQLPAPPANSDGGLTPAVPHSRASNPGVGSPTVSRRRRQPKVRPEAAFRLDRDPDAVGSLDGERVHLSEFAPPPLPIPEEL